MAARPATAAQKAQRELEDLQLVLRARNGDGSALDVRTKSADLRARGEYGEVEVKTASGDVQVEQAQETRIKSASGDIRLDHVKAGLEVQTASGDLHAGSVTRHLDGLGP